MSSSVERWRAVAFLVAVEFGLALVHIFFKKALNAGTDHVIIVVYRQSIGTVFLIPFVYFLESWTKLTFGVVGRMFLCAFLGLTMAQYTFLLGLDYTTATFTCAFINTVPVITFLLALPLRMEKLNIRSRSGRAKVLGSMTCAAGAAILSIYKGMPLINMQHIGSNNNRPKRFGLGSALLSAASVTWSSWFLIQSRIGQKFPYQYSSTLIMSFFCAAQSAALSFATTRDTEKWVLGGELQILSVVYGGVVGSGICYAVMSWCVKQKGPVFTSAFSPLIQVFAAVFDILLLREQVYLGSVLGSTVVIAGMYVLLWGKSIDADQNQTATARDKTIVDEFSTQDSSHDIA
ncbi:WAT1-related protein At3g30340-like isoform X2 [Andrographis paniculata]|uniref:WAT1-related protein At3g30340-like isoform X2 n=1 Tax=Andrographis paniculata TaxID=175694 RepID=UPI0021E813CB|nr:WAT1-related protein At3g30340-like isoform X2 [Andrographis paniculata]